MAIALEIRVGDLLPEFLAHASGVLRPLQAAGTVAAGALQPLPDSRYDLFILVQPNCHIDLPFSVFNRFGRPFEPVDPKSAPSLHQCGYRQSRALAFCVFTDTAESQPGTFC